MAQYSTHTYNTPSNFSLPESCNAEIYQLRDELKLGTRKDDELMAVLRQCQQQLLQQQCHQSQSLHNQQVHYHHPHTRNHQHQLQQQQQQQQQHHPHPQQVVRPSWAAAPERGGIAGKHSNNSSSCSTNSGGSGSSSSFWAATSATAAARPWPDIDDTAYHCHLIQRAVRCHPPATAAATVGLASGERRAAVAWLAAASHQLNLSRQTLHLATCLFDRYLVDCDLAAFSSLGGSGLGLPFACACLSLAAKLHEHEAAAAPRLFGRLLRQLGQTHSLLELECRLLSHFDGDLAMPTEATFADLYGRLRWSSAACGTVTAVAAEGWVGYFLDKLLQLDWLRLYRPNAAALSAVTAARVAMSVWQVGSGSSAAATSPTSHPSAGGTAADWQAWWCPTLSTFSGVDLAEASPLVGWLLAAWNADVYSRMSGTLSLRASQQHHQHQQQHQQAPALLAYCLPVQWYQQRTRSRYAEFCGAGGGCSTGSSAASTSASTVGSTGRVV